MPDVGFGGSYTFGDWMAGASFGYDESDESLAVKGAITGNFNMWGLGLFAFYSTSDENIYYNYDGLSSRTTLPSSPRRPWRSISSTA